MNAPPWTYIYHLAVPPIAALEPAGAAVFFDKETDTLFGDLWSLCTPTISCVVDRCEYLRIELDSRRPMGTQIESFTHSAVLNNPRYLELAAICEDLFKPTLPASKVLVPPLTLEVVHRAVSQATRAYDRLHGISSARPLPQGWTERSLRVSEERGAYAAGLDQSSVQVPRQEWVIDEFTRALEIIARLPERERFRDFDRMTQYWHAQPEGPIKQATARLLLSFARDAFSDQVSTRGTLKLHEDLLTKVLLAG